MRGLGLIVYGSEGVGKTSFGIEFEQIGPVRFCSINETGYDDIMQFRGPTKIEHIDVEDYLELLKVTQSCKEGSLVIDSTSGIQQILFDHVCRTIFNGQWDGKDGFTHYWKGQRVDSPKVLEEWLCMLDNLRNRGINVVILGHTEVDETPNTIGADYLTYTLNLDKGIRAPLIKWAQAVLFMNIDVNINIATEMDTKTKTVFAGKAHDIDRRLMYVSKSPGHIAKNRDLFAPNKPVIQMGGSSKDAFLNFYKALPELYRKAWPLKTNTQ